MTRSWIVISSALIAISGGAVVYHGFASGGWLWGLTMGVLIPAGALYEWLSLRESDPKLAADRLAIAFMLVMILLASDALNLIELRIFERLAP